MRVVLALTFLAIGLIASLGFLPVGVPFILLACVLLKHGRK